ncbi:type VI secretion protein [Novosphingobium sp. G106]|uniref:TrbI/VirB10 family protein n=1 Tax=Novosphingobium sp. G106 TaxID=2849500 RepID=UPI001C2DDE86|nr:TrbI/VirB10 family protein [Novosphingobium sp. G106]MBV1692262.1 type VI secretion protein [Novosphingobium sp. G106]
MNSQFGTRRDLEELRDPRDQGGAEVIDLATRSVLPQVAAAKGRSDGLGLAAGVAIVALLGGVTLWSMNAARDSSRLPPHVEQSQVSAAPTLPPRLSIVPSPTPLTSPGPAPLLAAPPQATMALAPRANPAASPAVVFDASAMPQSLAGPAVPGVPGGSGNSNDDFAARLGATGGNGMATATAMINPKTTVTQGTLIPAILETAIDTDVPGYVRAIVSADVRSFDGSRVLVPRSSRLIGQYKSGLQAGQKRAYVIWTRLIRPDGVSVNIASPAVTFSGETGLAGKVNSHFFARFGSAMLLSVIGGLSAIGGNAGVIIGGSGQSAAAAAVGQSGQIGPTVRVRQGEPIRVFTAKDLDFSKVETL